MKSKENADRQQTGMFQQDLELLLDPREGLVKLAQRIPWEVFEEAFSGYYSEVGRPAKPVRQMVGLLLLKQLKNLSDERVCEEWRQNPYFQYFCGERFFQWGFPCDPSELVHFRKRIGEEGVEKIFTVSVELHRDKIAKEDELVADTTVQEANITYPTDTKLRRRVIETLWRLGEDAGITWERSHRRLVPRLLRVLRTRTNRMAKQRRRAEKRLKTYGWRLLRQYERQASPGWKLIHEEQLAVCRQVLSQQTHDKNKVYSLHDPTVRCIAKGKAHKKYEFGRKASVAMLRESGVIVAAVSFEDNLYDGDTIEPTLIHANANADKVFDSCLVDLGYLGRPNFGSTEILTPRRKPSGGNYYQRRKQRRRFNRRSAIEPVIGHLKNDYRMARCFLRGAIGSSQNLLLAAAAWNFRKWMRESIFGRIFALLRTLWQHANPCSTTQTSLYLDPGCLLKIA